MWVAGGFLPLFACAWVGPDHRAQRLDPDGDGVPWPSDCESASADAHPGAIEVCGDGLDGDCDGSAGACEFATEGSLE